MTEQIRLTKIPHSKLKVFEKVIAFYLTSFHKQELTDQDKSHISIATCFYHSRIKNKVNSQYPSKKSTIKFFYHEAYVMIKVFLKYQNFTSIQDLDYAIVENFKIDLYKQLI
ncbi:hypothetical protein [Algibacter sp. PT7-4]|uniref:hypothetical protein n=1 Tax=Algibacter ulvanivorans TaxID=3400999 RepID=UPI003AACB9DF